MEQVTIPNDTISRQKAAAGGLWIGRNFAVGMVISVLIILGTIGYAITVTNQRAADNQRETTRVAKCSFQFSAYRAQYSGATNTALRPIAGLDPYAGLKLPPAKVIKQHLAENCQKYLVPFIAASK